MKRHNSDTKFWRIAHTTKNEVTLFVRADINGQLNAIVNNIEHTGDTIDTSVNDGTGTITIGGLRPATTYVFLLYVGDVMFELATFKTKPRDSGVLAFGSCQNRAEGSHVMRMLRLKPADAFVMQGDFIYCDTDPDVWGEICPGASDSYANAIDIDVYYAHYRSAHKAGYMMEALRTTSTYLMEDDHKYPGDGWNGSTTQANYNGLTTSTQAEVDAIEAVCNAAFTVYSAGNPVNNDDHADDDAEYYRFPLDDNTEVYVLDEIKYRNITSQPFNNPAHNMLGDNQENWLLHQLKMSTAVFKLICSPKKTFNGVGLDTDDWHQYTAQRDRILAAIDAAEGWKVPGGVIWLAGDVHNADCHVMYKDAADDVRPGGTGGDAVDHVCLLVGSVGQGMHTQGVGYADTELWKCYGESGTKHDRTHGYIGFVEIEGDVRAKLSVYDDRGDRVFPAGAAYVYAGNNYLTLK